MLRLTFGALAGACLWAASPALALSAETAGNKFSLPSQSLIIDRSRVPAPVKMPAKPLIYARPASPDVFGTVALNAGVTLYDARFRRVAAADVNNPLVQRLAAGVAGLDPMAKIAGIQEAVSKQIRWMQDLDNLGVADYWDNAADTLRRGVGDDEDIAIVKMQALKAAGFDPKDLYISIGRHSQRGAHILLVVRTAAGFMMLDDQGSSPMNQAQQAKFTPILTVGQGMSWIHGRRIGGTPTKKIASASAPQSSAR